MAKAEFKTLSCDARFVRALIVPDGEGWFVQGVDYDYAASGTTKFQAIANFEEGLEATAKAQSERGDKWPAVYTRPSCKTLTECLADAFKEGK